MRPYILTLLFPALSGCLQFPQTNSFVTKKVSLNKALKIMHTPEYAARCLGLSYPGFFLASTRPRNETSGGYSVLSFQYKTAWGPPCAGCMISRKPQGVHYMMLDQFKKPVRFVTLSLRESNGPGFAIGVDGTWLRQPTECEGLLYKIQPDLSDIHIGGHPDDWLPHGDPNVREWHDKFLTSARVLWGDEEMWD